ncbi:hypothetical protein T10_8268 [Trichinella papuae]|uniref:Uncharacterized protein n=1 Tax=Trichinella papuae TaxID=268474 RepID=A0A0V1MWL7_9BILA|nr:hypothetical protein T10_8268 [Trichinella papuae]
MGDVSQLSLVKSNCGSEGRTCKLKNTSKQKKYWDAQKMLPGRSASSIRNGKEGNLNKTPSAAKTTLFPTTYAQEDSAASNDPSASGQFRVFQRLRATKTKSGEDFLLYQSISKHILVLVTVNNNQQLFSIHASVVGTLVTAVYCLFTGKDIGTYTSVFQALLNKAAVLRIRLLPEYADSGLLASTSANQCREMSLSSLYRKFIRVAAYLKQTLWLSCQLYFNISGWHNRLIEKADKSHLRFYELLKLLITEHSAMDTLIGQLRSENATSGNLRRVSSVYSEKHQRVKQYMGEHMSGRRTLRQFLEALMYVTPEPI